jgi:hypothetical protein
MTQEELDALAAQIAAANPGGGTIIINGMTYNWVNFEELRTLLRLRRLNDLGAPIAVFCAARGGVDVYTVSGNQGLFSLYISPEQVTGGITQATTSGQNTFVAGSDTSSFYALNTGEVQANAPDGYAFTFHYETICGALPTEGAAPEVVEEEELPGFTIINRPRGG